jgi:Spy/CpxP family protein refolding chaperone
MSPRLMSRLIFVLGLVLAAGAVSPTFAQRGGFVPGRHDMLIDTFRLNRDQERAVKTIMDDAAKTATPVRDSLVKARAGIATAVTTAKPQADIDAAVQAYAVQSTAMAEIEMRALAKIMQTLTPEQRANANAVRSTFQLMRGAFITKNWNEPPNPDKGY